MNAPVASTDCIKCKNTVKPIETCYRNYRFRSRTEARWAIWLDAMNIHWQYELQGYDLGRAGFYLPDFKIKLPWRSSDIAIMGVIEGFSEFFFEVKPDENPAYNRQHAVLTKQLDTPLICVYGLPDGSYNANLEIFIPKYRVFYYDQGELVIPNLHQPNRTFHFHAGEHEDKSCLALCAHNADWYQPLNFFVRRTRYRSKPHLEYDTPIVASDTQSLIAAYKRAMSARFEHGAQP